MRGATQIWLVTRHQNGISAAVSRKSFRRETIGGISKCRLFSGAPKENKVQKHLKIAL